VCAHHLHVASSIFIGKHTLSRAAKMSDFFCVSSSRKGRRRSSILASFAALWNHASLLAISNVTEEQPSAEERAYSVLSSVERGSAATPENRITENALCAAVLGCSELRKWGSGSRRQLFN